MQDNPPGKWPNCEQIHDIPQYRHQVGTGGRVVETTGPIAEEEPPGLQDKAR